MDKFIQAAIAVISSASFIALIKFGVFLAAVIFTLYLLINRHRNISREEKNEYENDTTTYSPVDDILGKPYVTNPYHFDQMDPIAQDIAHEFDQRTRKPGKHYRVKKNPQASRSKKSNVRPEPRARQAKREEDYEIEESDELRDSLREAIRNIISPAREPEDIYDEMDNEVKQHQQPRQPKSKPQRQPKKRKSATTQTMDFLTGLGGSIRDEFSAFMGEPEPQASAFGSEGVFTTGRSKKEMNKLDAVARELGFNVDALAADDDITPEARRNTSILF